MKTCFREKKLRTISHSGSAKWQLCLFPAESCCTFADNNDRFTGGTVHLAHSVHQHMHTHTSACIIFQSITIIKSIGNGNGANTTAALGKMETCCLLALVKKNFACSGHVGHLAGRTASITLAGNSRALAIINAN